MLPPDARRHPRPRNVTSLRNAPQHRHAAFPEHRYLLRQSRLGTGAGRRREMTLQREIDGHRSVRGLEHTRILDRQEDALSRRRLALCNRGTPTGRSTSTHAQQDGPCFLFDADDVAISNRHMKSSKAAAACSLPTVSDGLRARRSGPPARTSFTNVRADRKRIEGSAGVGRHGSSRVSLATRVSACPYVPTRACARD